MSSCKVLQPSHSTIEQHREARCPEEDDNWSVLMTTNFELCRGVKIRGALHPPVPIIRFNLGCSEEQALRERMLADGGWILYCPSCFRRQVLVKYFHTLSETP
jgi:hypothetical protein